jgi:hypothetical protein
MVNQTLFLLLVVLLFASSHAQQTKKNIILVLTDDQGIFICCFFCYCYCFFIFLLYLLDVFLGGWKPMQKAQQLIGDTGATMLNWYAPLLQLNSLCLVTKIN